MGVLEGLERVVDGGLRCFGRLDLRLVDQILLDAGGEARAVRDVVVPCGVQRERIEDMV